MASLSGNEKDGPAIVIDTRSYNLTEIKSLFQRNAILRRHHGCFAKSSSGIKTIADLKGKKLIITQWAIASFDKFNEAIPATAGLTPACFSEESAAAGVAIGIAFPWTGPESLLPLIPSGLGLALCFRKDLLLGNRHGAVSLKAAPPLLIHYGASISVSWTLF